MPEKKKRISPGLRTVLALNGLLATAVAGFVTWGLTPAQPMPEVFELTLSRDGPAEHNDSWLTFVPDGGPPDRGFIFYPGGHVDFHSYAPAAQAIADHGYLVVLVRMPLSLAVFNPDAALDVIAAYPGIRSWAIGGHSLGGAMAANFVFTYPEKVQGLVLWAAYPAGSNDLSGLNLPVVSISASLDGLSTPEKIAASRPLLPGATRWVEIEGGNHAQFGWYGDQPGDQPAAISRQAQQDQVVRASVELLEQLP